MLQRADVQLAEDGLSGYFPRQITGRRMLSRGFRLHRSTTGVTHWILCIDPPGHPSPARFKKLSPQQRSTASIRANKKSLSLCRNRLEFSKTKNCLFVSQAYNINSTKSFRSFFYVKLYFFILFKTLVWTQLLYVISVNKDIFASICRLDESKSFFCIKPLYGSLFCHCITCICIVLKVPKKRFKRVELG